MCTCTQKQQDGYFYCVYSNIQNSGILIFRFASPNIKLTAPCPIFLGLSIIFYELENRTQKKLFVLVSLDNAANVKIVEK